MSLTRTEEEDKARKAVKLSFQHTGGLAAVQGGGRAAPREEAINEGAVPKNLITLDVGAIDSDSDSSSDEEA
jgi:hypothetical protein